MASATNPTTTTAHWHPCGLLNNQPSAAYSVVILNQPVNRNALNAVISGASLLVCADGGADRLLHYEQMTATATTLKEPNHHAESEFRYRLPDAIVGDLDSLSAGTEKHYRERGVQVAKDPDQYSTDFTKCLGWIRGEVGRRRQGQRGSSDEEDSMDVVVLGGLGGRVDQGFSQIHHLYMADKDPQLLKGRIYLLSEQSLSFVLANGQNVIHLEPGYFGENVGIIPVLGRALITTKGLEWDVEDWPTEFGGQVSTSNHIRSDLIQITFEGPQPLFTLELESKLSATSEK
ncbi:thiamine pyrophosphokinase [Exophiala aquamarina CBS 119918]|uniref:Thiamine pyrophosphokinase n=1 Tax=Exophiala aquamarina CBS 119918 TaxID=1182545 RepID=A0A072PDQ1_9EURO|nr:thiamine pyrophosphokinase [Exophiala aquamarina CBS 119918]KEF57418.1 thiamine pyrophosphokinase [Exophiala aquamarina CBS 119918]